MPCDPRFETLESQQEFLPYNPRLPGYRTDKDLIANGVVLTSDSPRYSPCYDLSGV
jgi:hypothetical protein